MTGLISNYSSVSALLFNLCLTDMITTGFVVGFYFFFCTSALFFLCITLLIQVASLAENYRTLLHVHEKKLQIERGQQVELHLLWHHQQLLLLVFHYKKVSPDAGRKQNKHKTILSFYVLIMQTFVFSLQRQLRTYSGISDRKYQLAQGFTVECMFWFFLIFKVM